MLPCSVCHYVVPQVNGDLTPCTHGDPDPPHWDCPFAGEHDPVLKRALLEADAQDRFGATEDGKVAHDTPDHRRWKLCKRAACR